MKNNTFAPLAKLLTVALFAGALTAPAWGFGFFLSKHQQAKERLFDQLFAQKPTPSRIQIREEYKKQIQDELVSLRFAPKIMGGITRREQNMLDQLNGLRPRTDKLLKLQLFKLTMLRRLQEPLRFFQSKLDKSPALAAYAFHPTLDALHTNQKFIVSVKEFPPKTADIQEILGSLFEQTSVREALKNWDITPLVIKNTATGALLWFPPAQAQQNGLEVKFNFTTRLIFADLTPAP